MYAHRDKIVSHLNTMSNVLDKVCMDYEKLILLGDFNVEKHISEFMSMYHLKNLIKQNLF